MALSTLAAAEADQFVLADHHLVDAVALAQTHGLGTIEGGDDVACD